MSEDGYVAIVDPSPHAPLAALLVDYPYRVLTYDGPDSFLRSFDADACGCVLVDVTDPQVDGLGLCSAAGKRRQPLIPFLFLSSNPRVPDVVAAMKAGVVEFFELPCDVQLLVQSIDAALQRDRDGLEQTRRRRELTEKIMQLSGREQEILGGLTRGRTVEQIATHLGISPKTVYMHRSHLMDKLRCDSVAELVRLRLLADGEPG